MRYGSVVRRSFKQRFGLLRGLTEDHHVIPKQWKDHPVIRKIDYDIHVSHNIVIMPTHFGMEKLNVRPTRLVHYGGHRAYNKYVKEMLDSIDVCQDPLTVWSEFILFHSFLKLNMRENVHNIPWLKD